MSLENCAVCSISCSFSCSNCKKVSYCGKIHQRSDRKRHKKECFPAKIQWSATLGKHLVATREIQAGENILEDEAIIVGPRSNLEKEVLVCLGCYDLIDKQSSLQCPNCHWFTCGPECYKNVWHSGFECKILKEQKVRPPLNSDEFLYVTILRCLLMKNHKPEVWDKLADFESHRESRRKQTNYTTRLYGAVNFIQNVCNQQQFDVSVIDRIFGILTVNGYSDSTRYFVKLYENGSKLSHSCLPNTRCLRKSAQDDGKPDVNSKLTIISVVKIVAGEALTQLYGTTLTGTYRRQELLKSVYFFTCTCPRCTDPSELGTNFSTLLCNSDKCKRKKRLVLPLSPLDESSKWKCTACLTKWTYSTLVIPALSKVTDQTGMSTQDELFSEFEFYSWKDPSVPLAGEEVLTMKTDYVIKMHETIQELEESIVHGNHYSLLPVKTAIIATIHNIIHQLKDASNHKSTLQEIFLTTVRKVASIFEILTPGTTRNRGIILFYLAKGLQFQLKNGNPDEYENLRQDMLIVWKEAQRIMSFEPISDTYRELINKCDFE